jgi:tetratricopeptide (TPR) repeat protein
LTHAIGVRPGDAHLLAQRGRARAILKQFEPAIADFDAALAIDREQPLIRDALAQCCNNRAWELVTGADSRRDIERALALATRAVELAPGQQVFLNTLGVVQYRGGRFTDAIASLERSLASGQGQFDAFDLFFLAMAHHRLGHGALARGFLDRAVRWVNEHPNLDEQHARELNAFRAEAEALLDGRELPDNAFAGP